MYAKIASTRWTLTGPPKSRIQGADDQYDVEFEHGLGCPTQRGTLECTCYVSRIRLVKTPVGRTIPTIEKDLGPELVFWHNEAERLQRRNNILWVGLILTSVTALIAVSGLAFELSLI